MEHTQQIDNKPFVMNTTNFETGEVVTTFLTESDVLKLLPKASEIGADSLFKSMQGQYPAHWIVPQEQMNEVEKMLKPSPLKKFNIFNWFRS